MKPLSPEGREKLEGLLKLEEGVKLFCYQDTTGNNTIGIGRNLSAKGIRMSEALLMLDNDINEAITELTNNLSLYLQLDDIRKIVLIDMTFEMGIHGLLSFKNMLSLLEAGKYEDASKDMLNSLWAKQVPSRAQKLSYMIETGIM